MLIILHGENIHDLSSVVKALADEFLEACSKGGKELLFPLRYPHDPIPVIKRQREARTREALEEAIGQALLTITAKARAGVVPALRLFGYSLTLERQS
jgi:hypothetical protein